MKIATFVLSMGGLVVFYLTYADWVDELLDTIADNYLGFDYEEVAPFISSGTPRTEEFDILMEELPKPPRKTTGPFIVAAVLASLASLLLLSRSVFFKNGLKLFQQTHASDFPFRGCRKNESFRKGQKGEDVPLQVIWKGNTLTESSMHCNLKDDKIHREVAKASTLGAGDEVEMSPSSSNESTVKRLQEIRKLLESEPDIGQKYVDKSAGTEDLSESSATEVRQKQEIDEAATKTKINGHSAESEKDTAGDPKLMNRIRLLESRLRLEELKNRNWINRMSRAEGILQQLNKQVERGIDSMSKRVNSGLPSGRAHRAISPLGDYPLGNPKNHQHRNQMDAVNAAGEENGNSHGEIEPGEIPDKAPIRLTHRIHKKRVSSAAASVESATSHFNPQLTPDSRTSTANPHPANFHPE